jgi:HEPN domain-containing protein
LQPPDDDVAALLLARADDDIGLVRACVALHDVSDAIVGFHAQQAAEKLLKAVLARRRIDHPFTHDLERLLELVEAAVGARPPGADSAAALTPWAVQFRYGDAPEDVLDRSEALALLEALRGWVIASLD